MQREVTKTKILTIVFYNISLFYLHSYQLSSGWFVYEGCSISFGVVVPFVSTIWNSCWIPLLKNLVVVVVVEFELSWEIPTVETKILNAFWQYYYNRLLEGQQENLGNFQIIRRSQFINSLNLKFLYALIEAISWQCIMSNYRCYSTLNITDSFLLKLSIDSLYTQLTWTGFRCFFSQGSVKRGYVKRLPHQEIWVDSNCIWSLYE